MNFTIKNIETSTSSLSNTALNPIFNASSLYNTPIDHNLIIAPQGSLLIYDGTKWTWTTSFESRTGPTGVNGLIMGSTGHYGIDLATTGPTGAVGTPDPKTGPTGPGTTVTFTGSSGPTGISITGYSGYIGPLYFFTGPTGAINKLGPAGPTGISTNGLTNTGPTGPLGLALQPRGPTGISAGIDGFTGVTGPNGTSTAQNGPTGSTPLVSNISGPTGPVGGGFGTEHIGPTGPIGFIPQSPLVAKINIPLQVVGPVSSNTLSGYTSQFSTSNFYISFNNDTIGLPFGLWKIVVDIEWQGDDDGDRSITLRNANPNSNDILARNDIPGLGVVTPDYNMFQQLTYIGNFGQNSVQPQAFTIELDHNAGNVLNISGTVSIFSYTNEVSIVPTDPDGPVSINAREFAFRFVNHDNTHPPLKVAVLYKDVSNNGGYISLSGGNASENMAPGNVKVSSLFFNWTDMNSVGGDPNIREIVLGGENIVYNSSQLYIAKTDLSHDNGLQLWTTSPDGTQSPPITQYYLNTTAAEFTMDVIEFTYNFAGGNTTLYTLTANQTNVDALCIPMTLSMVYKNNYGAQRMSNGPVGISASANTMFERFRQAATGTVFWSGLRPNSTATGRLLAPQHAPNIGVLDSYNNSYITQFWNKWQNPNILTFHPQNTGPASSWIRATLQTSGNVTDTSNNSLATIQAFGTTPVTFNIYAREIYNQCNNLYSNGGVWATATQPGAAGGTELNVKAFLAAALTRGVAQLNGDFLNTSSYVAAIDATNTEWNGYANRGANFYHNINPHIYGKIVHENANLSIIDSYRAPYAYGIAYDDTFGYSSTITSAQVGNATPASDTQALRAVVDIYENDNLP